MNALGMIEVQSIPLGVNAGDAMLKAATVQLVTAQPVCAGKYIVIVTGEVSAVSESVAAGKAEAGQRLIDSMVIPASVSGAATVKCVGPFTSVSQSSANGTT